MAANRPGAPKRLEQDKTLSERFCQLIAQGEYLDTAAKLCDVAPRLVRSWLRRGRAAADKWEDEHRQHLVPDGDFVYLDFYQAYQKADAEAQSEVRKRFWNAGSWQAAQAFAAKRWPKQYGPSALLRVDDDEDLKGADLVELLLKVPAGRKALEEIARLQEELETSDAPGE